jgi:hypothetical protein
MWLTGRLVPDHKTIADFRKDNGLAADSGGSRPRIRDDLTHHSDLISLGVPR